MSDTISIPPTFPPSSGAVVVEQETRKSFVVYAFDPEKPAEREMLRHLALLPGTKVSKHMGFTFISTDDPERAVWKYRLIQRLEAWRKARDEFRKAETGFANVERIPLAAARTN